jgi:acyl-CoA synthetase (AMP-forming)/AMP-acid ligase II
MRTADPVDVSFGTTWEAVARRQPAAIAISEPGRDYSYAEFDDRAARLAAALAGAGLTAGDTVACYLYNGATYLETVFAAFKIGVAPVNANYRYTSEELTALLADAGAAALVFSGELAANVAHAAAHVPSLRLLIRSGPLTDGLVPLSPDGAATARSIPIELPPGIPELDDLLAATPPLPAAPRPGSDCLFMYTGGTTGKPKGVIWRLADLRNSMGPALYRRLGADRPPATQDEAVRIAVAARAADLAPVSFPVVPLMHATGLFNAMGALLGGGRVVIARKGRLDPRHVWETVSAQRVRTLVVAGNAVCQPLVDELIAAEANGSPHDLSSLDSIVSSGTAMSDRIKRLLHERASVTISDAIASSEGGPFAIATTTSVADLPARFYLTEAAAVLTASGEPVAPGSDQVGMLAFAGPIPDGYHQDTAKTTATFRVIGGVRYSMPGDLVRVEPDGAIRFLGRGSGVINTGGEKVHPQEVEDVLLAHPDVTDASVVGVPDETWGERVVAVVATANQALTGTELQNAVRARLAGYKVPRAIILLTALPRTPTGKLEIARVKRLAATVPPPGDPPSTIV